ncbi:copper transporter, putative [Ricinus communis]|uniref:Copper transport protein n=1 Tax=Ricinus communis TaxID=3988 RepID=B9RQY6_RICCO|nr:copper transporter, putative [Ricinus communis]|eukprot:XP_002516155.1 copper transporter 5.1 [Ricinus communis]
MMHMTFYWSKEVTLLFDSWKTKTWLSYGLTLLVCVITSASYQFLENRRVQLKVNAANAGSAVGVDEPLLQSKTGGGKWSVARVAGAVLFGVNSAIGYLLMLAVMSFNGGVLLAAVFGLAIGYLLFRSEDENLTMILDNPCACA